MDSTQNTATMHHLTASIDHKKQQLFKVLDQLKTEEKSSKLSKIIVLTSDNFTADYLSCHLNLRGIEAASLHDFKSEAENDKNATSFNRGKVEVLVTNVDIKLTVSMVKHVINYDMFVPNILYFEMNDTNDIFHEEM